MAIVSSTNPPIINRSAKGSHTLTMLSTPSIITVLATLNCSNCAKKITIAKPLRNPSTTEWGMILVYFPVLHTPKSNWKRPISNTAAKRYSTPWLATSGAITIAMAAVDELIIPGLPVKMAATRPMTTAVCKLIRGLTHATKAKATASGIKASATVIPESISSLIWVFSRGNHEKRKEKKLFILFASNKKRERNAL